MRGPTGVLWHITHMRGGAKFNQPSHSLVDNFCTIIGPRTPLAALDLITKTYKGSVNV
jgi:hypothetical protein